MGFGVAVKCEACEIGSVSMLVEVEYLTLGGI